VAGDGRGDRGRVEDIALYDAQVGVLRRDRFGAADECGDGVSLGQRLRDHLLAGAAGCSENNQFHVLFLSI
jgi:hypothetical protein